MQSRTQFHIILDELAKYGRRHFSTEESLLARCNYPLLEQQKTEHVAYEEKVTDFLLSATFGELDRAGVADFLQQWWREHILVDDMHYRDFVIEHRALLQ